MKTRIVSSIVVTAMVMQAFMNALPVALAGAEPPPAPAIAVMAKKAPRAGCRDYNGDGKDDLAIGAPYDSVNGADYAGAVNVLYGSTSLLTGASDQFWTQDSTNVPFDAEWGDNFGWSLASGDFNGDGFCDLAIGVPHENVISSSGAIVTDAGAVNVLYGSASGLTATNSDIWHQDSAGVDDTVQEGDKFGWSLAAGDFNGDGKDDLAIGVPYDDPGTNQALNSAGVVNVLYGATGGLTAGSSGKYWHQDIVDVDGDAEYSDLFGYSLAAGDFDGDGKDDLAIGAPFDSIDGFSDAGVVNVLYGSSTGLYQNPDDFWHQGVTDLDGDPEESDRFGYTLAAGDFDGDGYMDLAIGVPYESIDGIDDVGAVNVLYGSSGGLTQNPDDFWHQNISGVDGDIEKGDMFGYALAAGDFDNNGYDDLAIGAPHESVNNVKDAGAVNVLAGTANGLSATPDEFWHQDQPGVDGIAEKGDWFGFALAAGDFDGDGKDDLAIGVPYESVEFNSNEVDAAGAINVLAGSSSLLSDNPDELWHQNNDTGGLDVKGTPEEGDTFGRSLSR